MGDFLQAIGAIGVFFLVVTGLLAGWIASSLAGGRHRLRYVAIGVLGALAMPLILTALGAGLLAAGGIIAILAAALVGAVAVLVIAKLIFD